MAALSSEEFYKQVNLRGNPFRSNAMQEVDWRNNIWVGYEKEKNTFWKFLERSRADQVGNSNFLMVYGDFGTGKSHALLWAKHQIMDTHQPEFNSVCYYIQTLRKDGKISFAAAYRDDIVGKSNLINDLKSYRHFVLLRISDYIKETGLPAETAPEAALKKLVPSQELFNFIQRVIGCGRDEDFQNFVDPQRLTDFGAMTLFCGIVNSFVFEFALSSGKQRFKKGVYLFIDELDLLATSSVKEGRDTNELLRHVYDLCPSCFCLALGFTATAAEINILFTEYVISRVSKQIVMQQLDQADACAFVSEILKNARVKQSKGSNFAPFEESAVQEIISQIVSITPRKVINAMQQILEEVRLTGFDGTKGLVTAKYLNDREILSDVLGQ
jgi:hypothetical protein